MRQPSKLSKAEPGRNVRRRRRESDGKQHQHRHVKRSLSSINFAILSPSSCRLLYPVQKPFYAFHPRFSTPRPHRTFLPTAFRKSSSFPVGSSRRVESRRREEEKRERVGGGRGGGWEKRAEKGGEREGAKRGGGGSSTRLDVELRAVKEKCQQEEVGRSEGEKGRSRWG